MKTLYLIRHASANAIEDGNDDFERSLSLEGKMDAADMGRQLFLAKILPQEIVVSPAFRTIATARKIVSEIGFPIERIKLDMRIYDAGIPRLLNVIGDVNDTIETLFIIGHNPGMNELANWFSGQEIRDFPPGTVVGLKIETDSWKELHQNSARINLQATPGNFLQ